MAMSTRPFSQTSGGPATVEVGVVVQNVEIDGLPVGLCQVRLLRGNQLMNVPVLMPFSSFRHVNAKGDRAPGGSGLFAVPNPGDMCLLVKLDGRAAFGSQWYILGFFTPVDTMGKMDPSQRNPSAVRPGSMSFLSPYGSGLVLHNGGGLHMIADSSCERTMNGILSKTTPEDEGSRIQDICRNYRLYTSTGVIELKEMGSNKYGYRLRVEDMSRWSDPLIRAARGTRFVEIQYGHVKESDDVISRVAATGNKSCVVTMDKDGNRSVVVDSECSESSGGGQVIIRANAEGRTVEAPSLTYSVRERVRWTCPLMVVDANVFQINGQVVFNSGGRWSARLYDMVASVGGVLRIVQGDPLVWHS